MVATILHSPRICTQRRQPQRAAGQRGDQRLDERQTTPRVACIHPPFRCGDGAPCDIVDGDGRREARRVLRERCGGGRRAAPAGAFRCTVECRRHLPVRHRRRRAEMAPTLLGVGTASARRRCTRARSSGRRAVVDRGQQRVREPQPSAGRLDQARGLGRLERRTGVLARCDRHVSRVGCASAAT